LSYASMGETVPQAAIAQDAVDRQQYADP